MNIYRTSYCGLVTENDIEKQVTLSGWVENIRDHGGILFVDLRDEKGVIQLVTNDDNMFKSLSKESTITVKGVVRKRNEEDYNDKISTGKVEVLVNELTTICKAKTLPFEIVTSHEVNEETRLKYRFLDLRNPKVHDNIILRSKIISYLRRKMESLGFTEFQTPIISASSPEGARDFVIPSRHYKGKFYALPQAPQIYKQLLMVSGFDRYFQIAPCFRDEDCRSDRTLEFYQLDFEMSFATEEDVYKVGEEVFYDTFKEFSNKTISDRPFRRIPYKEAILKYGTDKPDLRNPLHIIDVSDIFTESSFKPFRGVTVRAIKVDDIGDKSNSWFNEVVDYAKSIEMPGIGYITLMEDNSFKGPIDKFLTDEDRKRLIEEADLKVNSVLFFIADRNEKVAASQAGLIRTELGRKLDLIDKNRFEFCIINDFPMYELNDGKYEFGHNPFSMPQGGLDALENKKPDEILAYQYDFVCNGYEMASGAVRNHDINIMEKAFEIAGYTKEDVKTKFKSLYEAFQFGAPPHAGMGPGIDRMIMLIADEPNLREVQVFPVNVSCIDNLMGSPSELTEEQLRELHLKIR